MRRICCLPRLPTGRRLPPALRLPPREVGRPAASPVMLLQFLYDISDRRIVEEVRYHMAFKWFCGLEVR